MKRYTSAEVRRLAKGLVLRKWRKQLSQKEVVEQVESMRLVYGIPRALSIDVYGKYERGQADDIPDDHSFLLCRVHNKTQEDLHRELLEMLPIAERQLEAKRQLIELIS
ncbi:MAG: hypothetical protein NZ556_07785 [Fimbriimonadales bacterium]|nr:hypothetical protein [Fimbriimonadales bacterium]